MSKLTFAQLAKLKHDASELHRYLAQSELDEAREKEELITLITRKAQAVKGRALWPAWSTGETLMVAIVLDQPERLKDEGYTMAEAFNRVDLSVSELLAIQRELS